MELHTYFLRYYNFDPVLKASQNSYYHHPSRESFVRVSHKFLQISIDIGGGGSLGLGSSKKLGVKETSKRWNDFVL